MPPALGWFGIFGACQLKEHGNGLTVTKTQNLTHKKCILKTTGRMRKSDGFDARPRGSHISAVTLGVDFFIFWFDFWFVAFSHHHLSRVWTLWKWGDQNWSERLPRMVAEYGYGVVPGRSIECHRFCHRLLPLGLSAPLPVPVMSHL